MILTKITLHIDKAARFAFGLACCFQVWAILVVVFGRQGILLALQYSGDGTKVEPGQTMLSIHGMLLIFYVILFVINWFAGLGWNRFRWFFERYNVANYPQQQGGNDIENYQCAEYAENYQGQY